jgi:ABC-type nickel/cobalt efflux system permease component RcnA
MRAETRGHAREMTKYQRIGSEEDALNVFWAMLTEGFRPNGVTFLVLIACTKAKLIEEGLTTSVA